RAWGQVAASGGVLRTDAVHSRGVVRQHDRPNALSGTSCQLNAQPANRLAVKAEGIRWDEASSSERDVPEIRQCQTLQHGFTHCMAPPKRVIGPERHAENAETAGEVPHVFLEHADVGADGGLPSGRLGFVQIVAVELMVA